jgi:uncharacterized protein YbjT (DUF2867 family)
MKFPATDHGQHTGTSGGLASVVLEIILDKKLLAPNEFRLSSYSGQTKSTKAIAAGIEVRRGDMREPATLVHAFEGAEAVFLVSYPSVGEERYELHRNAIDAAKKAGVKHIIYTSLTFGGITGEKSTAGVMQAHIKTVNYLKASSLSWTIVREATYAHLWNNFAGFLRLDQTGEFDVVVAEDGPNSWASRQDLGEGNAQIVGHWVRQPMYICVSSFKVLTFRKSQRDYVGQTINLTGPQLLTIKDIVDLYTKHTGRKVNFRIVSPKEAIEYHKRHNTLPAEQTPFLSNWASWHVAMKNGEVNYLDPTLEQLVSRKLQTIEAMADVLFKPEENILDTKDFV